MSIFVAEMNETDRIFGQATYIQNRLNADDSSGLHIIHRFFILLITLTVPGMFIMILGNFKMNF